MRICFGCSRLPTRLLFSCAMVAAVTLQSTAESTQGGPNPLVCLGHFSGSFSAHESMALNSSPQIQDTLIASNSESGCCPLRLCGTQGKSRAKGKGNRYPTCLGNQMDSWPSHLLKRNGARERRWKQGEEVIHGPRQPCSDQRLPSL